MNEASVIGLAVVILCLLVAMSLHEFMHALAGYKLGDDTARQEGRLSLNPLKHIDPIMTVLVPAIAWAVFGFLIMAAKPVPFNPRRVRFGEYGSALIAIAGPLTNLVLAVGASAAVYSLGGAGSGLLAQVLSIFMHLNVALFVFNLIPIPPLDGSRVLYAFAPEPVQDFMEKIEPYGFFILLALVLAGGLGTVLVRLNENVIHMISFGV